eukprot:CAMPEP_0171947030 /NCGR_PEP_ID=MMETSP0993-20121228/58865_1 /TAXON_ID=483369 /ORGANISM="non described non described, Strain CCMP2098" /LENGTH=84 /DNA_ID=CAMNT_0012590651 /DNA_START=57 /DNA_END=308 /DNA_ORIENTATION=-
MLRSLRPLGHRVKKSPTRTWQATQSRQLGSFKGSMRNMQRPPQTLEEHGLALWYRLLNRVPKGFGKFYPKGSNNAGGGGGAAGG